jgi:hypothetical protein
MGYAKAAEIILPVLVPAVISKRSFIAMTPSLPAYFGKL